MAHACAWRGDSGVVFQSPRLVRAPRWGNFKVPGSRRHTHVSVRRTMPLLPRYVRAPAVGSCRLTHVSVRWALFSSRPNSQFDQERVAFPHAGIRKALFSSCPDIQLDHKHLDRVALPTWVFDGRCSLRGPTRSSIRNVAPFPNSGLSDHVSGFRT